MSNVRTNRPLPQIRRHDPDSRMQLQWDKLFINNETFVYCEETGSVEHETEVEVHCNGTKSAGLRSKRSFQHGRSARRSSGMTRAYSTETSLSLPLLTSPTKQAKEPPVDLETVIGLEDEIETDPA